MIWGTSHFVSETAAIKYYNTYSFGFGHLQLKHKLESGEIHIGKPELKANQTCFINDKEGRYFIQEGE